jgi:predicted aldo/keto reductase-like oxidoreductase
MQGDWTRRRFLVASGIAGVGLTVAPRAAAEEEEAMVGVDGMPLVVLGRTKAKVSILGFGGAVTVSPPLLNAALRKGVNFIDTAEGYGGGNSERVIGEVLEANGTRKDMFIVTKTGDHNPANLERRLDGSLQRLRTDYVDALYLHDLGSPNRLDDTMRAAADALRRSKKIRFFGFSCHNASLIPVLKQAVQCGFVDLLMLRFNFRDYDNDALNAALDECAQAKIGLVAMKTGAGAIPRYAEFEKAGLSRPVASLKATWADGRIHVIASKMGNIPQVEQNAAAAKDRKMSRAEWELFERYARATDHLYCRGCGDRCEPATETGVAIADILRYKMYCEGYGEPEHARELFAALPARAKRVAGVDFRAAEAACPYRVPIGRLLAEAVEQLA